MRAVVITKHGDLSALQVQERPDPPPPEPLQAAMSDGVVHAAVPFANAAEAHRILAARENVGKVVLVP